MNKHFLLALVAAVLLSFGATMSVAQSNDQAPSEQQSMPAKGNGHMHGDFDPAQRTQHLSKKLNLTADQQTKVQGLFESEQSQMQNLHQDSSMSQQDRRSKMMEIHKTTDTQVRALLDSTQQKKWDEMQAKREQWVQNKRSGSPDNSGAQNPPQE